MKAMVFAAGLGTRLRPLTDSMPKALVEVAGVPALRRVLERIADAGIRDVVVNVHHFPELIINYLTANENFGLNISISNESDRLLDTGGGLLEALTLLGDDEPVLLHNADIVTDFSIAEMIHKFECEEPDAMLLVSERDSSRRLLFDSNARMHGWKNMSTGDIKPATLVVDGALNEFNPKSFGGVHILSPSIFGALREYAHMHGRAFSITPFYVDVCKDFKIIGFEPAGAYRWHDIGSLEKLAAAEASFRCNNNSGTGSKC